MPAVKRKAVSAIGRIPPKIISWFQSEAREMPWRRTLDPYGIWVSEIMLQQTQVKTVIPYWNRWMKRLPTIDKLANAREATILKLWEGLGYYTRVRNIQKAARQIRERHDGRFPNEPGAIQDLAGIGRYTTGAIASIAFNLPEPILDGNVIRVLARVFGISGDPKSKSVNERLWQLSSELIAKTTLGTPKANLAPLIFSGERSLFNQGMMELGATICTPTIPDCESCPLNRECIARQEGRIDELPETAKRPKSTSRSFVTIVLRRGDEILVRKRSRGRVNAGFWEFPNLEITAKQLSPREACLKLFDLYAEPELIDRFKHSITRYQYKQAVYQVIAPPSLSIAEGEWIPIRLPQNKPFYSPQIRIFKKLGQ